MADKIIVHAPDKSSGHRKKVEIYYNAVGILKLPTATEDNCSIALRGRCKEKKKAG